MVVEEEIMETMVLIGSEDVLRAGHTMSDAAERMSRAAAQFHETLSAQERYLDSFLERLEIILGEHSTSIELLLDQEKK